MSELSPLAWRLRRCLLALDRERLQLAEVWACLLAMTPELAGTADRRTVLRSVVDELVSAGWLSLPAEPTAWSHRPTPALPRWLQVLRPEERARRLGGTRATAWRPELAWAVELELAPDDLEDLRVINAWLDSVDDGVAIVPPRERSLQLFGAGREDRLHEMARSPLFAPNRLTWELLVCAPVPPPFVWSPVGAGGLMLVISGHETFASVRRTLVEAPETAVGLVVHGAGRYFASSIPFARTMDRPIERILYYGDLDAADLRTPRLADDRSTTVELPAVEPATALYELLLRHGHPAPATPLPIEEARELARWFDGRLRTEAAQLLVGGLRLAQEWVGYEVLVRERVWLALA